MSSGEHKCVVFCIEALTIGGAEQMMVAMANRFVDRDWQVHVVCLTEAGDLAVNLSDSVQLHVLEKQPGFDKSLPSKLRKLIRSINPSVINSHLWVANLWTRVSLLGLRIPTVVTEHSRDYWKPWHYRFIDRLLSRVTFKLVAVSNDTAQFYREDVGIDKDLVTVINNGVDTQKYAAGNGEMLRQQWRNDHQLLLGTVGRMVPAKNHLRLLDMAGMLRDDDIHFKLVIAGDGPERDTIEKGIAQRRLSEQVVLLGSRNDIPDILSALDLFVLSSDREGHPLTALESQAAGTPVLLTNAGGSADAIAIDGDQRGGLLVAKQARDLAQAVKMFVSDENSLSHMAEFAQRHALAHFDTEHMVDQYENLFIEGVSSNQ